MKILNKKCLFCNKDFQTRFDKVLCCSKSCAKLKKPTRYWSGKKRELSDAHIENIKKTRVSGENHYNWKGGITKESEKIRKSRAYIKWRNLVFERDDYTCQLCNKRSTKGSRIEIQADHIKPFAKYPQLRFEISNGRTLCVECHRLTPTWGVKMKTL